MWTDIYFYRPEAYDALLRGWAHYLLFTPDDLAKAIPYLEEAIQLDPDYGRAHAALATVYFDISNLEWMKSVGMSMTEAEAKSRQHLEEALKDATPLAHRVASKLRMSQHRWDEAIAEAERAIALDANDPTGYAALSTLLVKVGRPAEGLELIETAMRLDPQTDYLYRLGNAQFHLERYDEAAATMLRATKRNPGDEWNFLLLAAAYGYLGREQEAKSAIDTFNEMRLKVGMHSYTLADIDDWYFKEPAARKRLREGLRKGGLPAAKLVPRVAALSPDELRNLFSGNTATGDSTRGKWHVYWAPDGKAFMRSSSGRTDEGSWEINDDGEFCRQFANFGGGRKACFIYVQKGDEYEIWTADRSRMRGTLKVRPGNPENLK